MAELPIEMAINRYDSLLRGWRWDFEVKSAPTMIAWRFSTIAGGGWLYDDDGSAGYDKVPMEAQNFIVFFGQSPSGRIMRCTAMTDR